MNMTRRHLGALTLGITGMTQIPAFAQAYPNKSIRIVVGFPPGGGADFAARTISTAFAKALGQTVYIENKAGANGSIGGSTIAKGTADGYSVLVSTSGAIVLNPSLIKPAPYDSNRDLAPIGKILTNLSTFVANPAVKGQNMRELVEWSKKNKAPISIASSGVGSIPHMAIELLATVSGAKIVHVPYKGAGPAMTDTIGGQVDCFVGDVSVVLPQIKAGRIRAMGVASAARSPSLSDVPTLIEQGFPGTLADNWYGMFAPANTPAAIVEKLNDALRIALQDPEVLGTIRAAGGIATPSSPQELGQLVRTDILRWKKIIDEKTITLDS